MAHITFIIEVEDIDDSELADKMLAEMEEVVAKNGCSLFDSNYDQEDD